MPLPCITLYLNVTTFLVFVKALQGQCEQLQVCEPIENKTKASVESADLSDAFPATGATSKPMTLQSVKTNNGDEINLVFRIRLVLRELKSRRSEGQRETSARLVRFSSTFGGVSNPTVADADEFDPDARSGWISSAHLLSRSRLSCRTQSMPSLLALIACAVLVPRRVSRNGKLSGPAQVSQSFGVQMHPTHGRPESDHVGVRGDSVVFPTR